MKRTLLLVKKLLFCLRLFRVLNQVTTEAPKELLLYPIGFVSAFFLIFFYSTIISITAFVLPWLTVLITMAGIMLFLIFLILGNASKGIYKTIKKEPIKCQCPWHFFASLFHVRSCICDVWAYKIVTKDYSQSR